MKQFQNAGKIQTVIDTMQKVDEVRAQNRTRINELFNGNPPYTEEEAKDNRINTNVNFLEGSKIAHDARRQFENAFLKPGNYFTVKLDIGPQHKRSGWSKLITKQINKLMKRSAHYDECLKSTFAQVVLHGIGPSMWDKTDYWTPKSMGIEDVLVPSNTLVGMTNLPYFAVYRRYTPFEMYRMTHGSKANAGWNMGLVNRLLQTIQDPATVGTGFEDSRFPEKTAENYKENGVYYQSDAVPTINAWDFYFQDPESDEESWNRRMVLDWEAPTSGGTPSTTFATTEYKDQFIFNPGKRQYSDKLAHLIHWQFGNCANVAPFRYHSVRSLGYLLYQICHLQNRFRCKFTDAGFEAMLMYFRNVTEEDREKLESVQLYHMGIIPEGLSLVPQSERFQVNGDLVQANMSQMRQLMSENSASFTQDVNDGTAKELTATEVMQRVNASAALTSALLNNAYNYQTYQYREICTRFCRKASEDRDIKAFQKFCQKEGIPDYVLDTESWEIEPERTLGTGNKMLEIAQADKLLSARNLYDATAQQEILHIFTEANTDDPHMAERLVPLERKEISDAAVFANFAISTLMMGLPVVVKRGINEIDYVETLLALLGMIVQQVEESGGMTTPEKVAGMSNTHDHIAQHIQIIAQDENEGERVKEYSDNLGQLMNLIKAYAQRLEEQAQQAQMDPAVIAKIQNDTMLAQTKARNSQEAHMLKLQQKQEAFQSEQGRKAAKANLDMEEKSVRLQSDLGTSDVETQADIIRKNAETKADIARKEKESESAAKVAAKKPKKESK